MPARRLLLAIIPLSVVMVSCARLVEYPLSPIPSSATVTVAVSPTSTTPSPVPTTETAQPTITRLALTRLTRVINPSPMEASPTATRVASVLISSITETTVPPPTPPAAPIGTTEIITPSPDSVTSPIVVTVTSTDQPSSPLMPGGQLTLTPSLALETSATVPIRLTNQPTPSVLPNPTPHPSPTSEPRPIVQPSPTTQPSPTASPGLRAPSATVTFTVVPTIPSATPTLSSPVTPTATVVHAYYLSSYPEAYLYYCDTDLSWRDLSPRFLVRLNSVADVQRLYPGRTLDQPC